MATQSTKLDTMSNQRKRGSEKLMKAWKSRVLTEDAFREITEALEKSPATLEAFNIVGGENPTGVQLSLRYDGEDGPWCGNDILFWLKWHLQHGSLGGVIKPPRIIINGTPWPEAVTMALDFGRVSQAAVDIGVSAENIGGSIRE
jgi:hypothetical protein